MRMPTANAEPGRDDPHDAGTLVHRHIRTGKDIGMISHDVQDGIAILTMDDGKRNVVNPAFASAMNDSLDAVEAQGIRAVVLKGREGTFSAGFDLKEFQKGHDAAMVQVRAGFELLVRLFSFPRPVVGACTGHGIGMGAFLLMTCDYRVGMDGDLKFGMPESRIGLDLTGLLGALAQARISPQYLTRMAILSEDFDPATALAAGVLDELVAADRVLPRALEVAESLATMPAKFGANKLTLRQSTLGEMKAFLAAFPG